MRIHTIDLAFQGIPRAIAAYLVEGPDGPLLFETGPASTYPALETALAARGVAPADLAGVFVSHIHLDHSGAAGHLARQGARIHVHPVGASHLVDPARLLRSAGRIYGDDMDRLWGRSHPVPAEQVIAVADGQAIQAGGLVVNALATPGHAGHHHCWRIDDLAFTGDVAGVRLPGERWVALPAPPPEIDIEAWEQSLDRLAALGLRRLYPTHFGASDEVAWHLAQLRAHLRDAAERVRRGLEEGLERDPLVSDYVAWNRALARAEGVSDATFAAYEAANPLAMSVDGLSRYWRKRRA